MKTHMGYLKLGVIGDFFPHVLRSANVTTGIAILLGENDLVQKVVVYGPEGTEVPYGLLCKSPTKVSVVRSWKLNSPLSLLRLEWRLLRNSRRLDGFVFNTIVRTYGNNPISNGLGLLLPTILAWISRKPVLVYSHSMLDTQNNAALGFVVSRPIRFVVRTLESLMLANCNVVVRLRIQSLRLQKVHGVELPFDPLPFVDAVSSFNVGGPRERGEVKQEGDVSVLVFGIGGPHKDLEIVAKAVDKLQRGGLNVTLTLAGGVAKSTGTRPSNPLLGTVSHRSNAGQSLTFDSIPTGHGDESSVNFVPIVEEKDVAALFRAANVVVLPYLAAGGFSSVMCLAAFYGTKIVAFDLPEFRETASALKCVVDWISPGDMAGLAAAIAGSSSQSANETELRSRHELENLSVANLAVASLINYLRQGDSKES